MGADYIDVPPEVITRLRGICGALPDANEESAWAGVRWRIRNRTFASVWTRHLELGPVTRLQFRSPEPEFGFLVAAGPPYERAGWGSDVVNVYLDGRTDWQEVAELLTESYCIMAPKRLAALVSRSGPGR